MPTYDLGDPVPLTVQTYDATGTLADAGAITVTITHPDGLTTDTPTPTHPSTGQYQTDYMAAEPGHYDVRWVATGANTSAYTDSFDVLEANPRYIVSLADAKELLRFANTTASDEEIRRYNAAATELIETYLDQIVVRKPITAEEHYYNDYHHRPGRRLVTPSTGSYSAASTQLWVNHRPVLSLTSLGTIDGLYTWNTAGLHVDRDTGEITPLPGFPSLWGDITIDYVAGYQIIPPRIQEAARIVIQHLWGLRRGLAGNLVTQQLPGFNIGYALPQSVKDLLGPQAPVFA